MIFLVLLLAALVAIYYYGTRTHSYWKTKGIKYEKPIPLLGTNCKVTFGIKSLTEHFNDMYWKHPNEKAVGLYFETLPTLLIRDPEIVKRVLVTEFGNVYMRGFNMHKEVIEPLARNLFFVDGDMWRLLRQRMTPAFTSGKLKAMFPLVVECAEGLQIQTLAMAKEHRAIDARDLVARYTTDFIGACGFGLEIDSLNDENSPFRTLGKKIFDFGYREIAIAVLKNLFPEMFKNFKLFGRIENEIVDLVKQILHQRNYEPSGRNDFIDLLLECKKKGVIFGESIEKKKPDGTPETVSIEMDDILMAAQVFVFFAAGFETSSSATSYTLHQLAYNQEAQKKVQDEIDRVLAKHNNKLSYDALKEMTYLEWSFKEGMRMFPSLGFLIRECARPTTIPELNVTLDTGVKLVVPVQAMQNDSEYFDNPSVFRPERFHPDEFSENNKYVYLPFGVGPRACIGERLGLMQSMAGLAALLAKFSVRPAPETKKNPIVEPKSGIVQVIKGGLPLLFEERKRDIS